MQITILNPNKDPMGAAIREYQQTGKAEKIRVLSSMFDEDEIDEPILRFLRCYGNGLSIHHRYHL